MSLLLDLTRLLLLSRSGLNLALALNLARCQSRLRVLRILAGSCSSCCTSCIRCTGTTCKA